LARADGPATGGPGPGTSGGDAEALFRRARELRASGKNAEACATFEQSLELADTVGTRLNLADCNEALGRLATAYRGFVHVAQSAPATDNRRELADRRAHAIEPRLPKVIAVVADPTVQAKLEINGVTAAANEETLVDPGPVKLRITAPGYRPVEIEEVAAEGKLTRVEVPPLSKEPNDREATQGPNAPDAAGPLVPPNEKPPAAAQTKPVPVQLTPLPPNVPARASRRRPLGLGLMIGGGATVGLGLAAGFHARSLWNDAFDSGQCNRESNDCTSEGQALTDRSRRWANLSNLGVGVGLVAAGAGVYLFLTADKPPQQAVLPVFGANSAGVAWHTQW
jgi:hypothetical protein